MNRSFLIIFIPAAFVAAGYLYMGIRPPLRIGIGIAIFAGAVAVIRLRAMMQNKRRNMPADPAATSKTPLVSQLPAAPAPSAPPAAHQP